jgi:hypothetical protein
MRKATWLAVLLLLCASIGHAASDVLLVTATGQGGTRAEAIKAAQIQAISEAETDFQVTCPDSDLDSRIWCAIKGIRVKTVNISATGLYEAEIEAAVIRNPIGQSMRPQRIAILYTNDVDDADFVMSTILGAETALSASRQMTVLDRNDASVKELGVRLRQLSLTQQSQILKSAKLPQAELLGLLSIESLTERKDSFDQTFFEVRTRISLMDTASRDVRFVKSITTLYPASKANARGTLATAAGQRVAKAIIDDIYPITVISEMSGVVTVSATASTLKVGQSVILYRVGPVTHNKVTGERMGREETPVGAGEVISVGASYANIVTDGFVKMKADYIAKPVGPMSASQIATEADW